MEKEKNVLVLIIGIISDTSGCMQNLVPYHKEGGNRVQLLLSTAQVISRKEPGTENRFSSLHARVFLLQKDQRQPSTMPHIYLATRLTRVGTQQRLEHSDSHFGARHCNYQTLVDPFPYHTHSNSIHCSHLAFLTLFTLEYLYQKQDTNHLISSEVGVYILEFKFDSKKLETIKYYIESKLAPKSPKVSSG